MSIKDLGKDSLIYGTGHVLARLITFFLLPIYTHVFTPEEYGVVSLAYAFIGFTLMLYRYGMDTALMKYSVQLSGDKKIKHISSIYILQFLSSIIFSTILYIFRDHIAKSVISIDKPDWIVLIVGIIFLDNLWNHHVLLLRAEKKPVTYILFNIGNVIMTMIFNIIFVIRLNLGIEGVLFSNILSSFIVFIFSLPIIYNRVYISKIEHKTTIKILKFGLPFLPAGIFTMAMELSNRYILDWLVGTYSVGLFSAGYKLGILGLIVVMGFNMGWTPYFLKRIKDKNYEFEFSQIASLFLGFLGLVVIIVSLWISEIIEFKIGSNYLIGEDFWAAKDIVPVILLGYFFFGTYIIQLPGVYVNKITNWIPIFRAIGAVTTITLNILFIPTYGVLGSAWATAIGFLFMSLSVFIKLLNIYKVRYNWIAILYPILIIVFISQFFHLLSYRVIIILFYFISWYYIALNKKEKDVIKGLVT